MPKENNYKSETAGKLMTVSVPVVELSATRYDIENLLAHKSLELESINYVYVVDGQNRLKGVLSLKEVFSLPKDGKLSGIMNKNVISVRHSTDQERVARLAIKHNLKAIPVIDTNDHFLGAVTWEVILKILHDENIEDFLRSAGIHKFDDPSMGLVNASALTHFRKRLPWLIVGLVGGILAALIVSFFEDLLAQMILLAAFIPMIVYMADAVGAQSQTIFIRSLAVDTDFNFQKYSVREFWVSLYLSLTLSIIIAIVSMLWWQSSILATVLAISFFVTINISTLVAITLPWLFEKKNIDPAIASGPFATVVRDILSIVIYFGIAALIMTLFA